MFKIPEASDNLMQVYKTLHYAYGEVTADNGAAYAMLLVLLARY